MWQVTSESGNVNRRCLFTTFCGAMFQGAQRHRAVSSDLPSPVSAIVNILPIRFSLTPPPYFFVILKLFPDVISPHP